MGYEIRVGGLPTGHRPSAEAEIEQAMGEVGWWGKSQAARPPVCPEGKTAETRRSRRIPVVSSARRSIDRQCPNKAVVGAQRKKVKLLHMLHAAGLFVPPARAGLRHGTPWPSVKCAIHREVGCCSIRPDAWGSRVVGTTQHRPRVGSLAVGGRGVDRLSPLHATKIKVNLPQSNAKKAGKPSVSGSV